jgi:hypothetical protein
MSITIIKNDAPNLNMPTMLCDNDIHEKLNQYELTKFLNTHSTNLLIGKPKSGKTSLLVSFFSNPKILRKCFHNIFLIMPSDSVQSLKKNIFEGLPPDQIFDDLTVENMESIMDMVRNEDKAFNNCLIIDDMAAKLKNNDTLKTMKELVNNRRHLRLSIYFLSQTYFSVPKEIRRLFTNVFVFRTSKTELKTIFDELVEGYDKYLLSISKLVYDKPYQWLFINTDSQRFFKGFDELKINDDDNFI